MSKKVKQFRYYNDGSSETSRNQPSYVEDEQLTLYHYVSGKVFEDSVPILQLGIQAFPGTKFYLNNAIDSVIIGSTGIFELTLDGQTQISSLQFDVTSMKTINENENAYLIVDIVYDGGD
jgi:hypothetical protein